MKRLLILSGKGGTGKTTISAAFIALSHAKAIADCDVDAPNLHLVLSHDSKPEISDFMGGDKALVDTNLCVGCKACESHCRFDAIHVTDGCAIVNEFACEGCGVCSLVCPKHAVALHPDIAGTKAIYLNEQIFSTATLKMGRGNSGKLVSDVKQAMIKAAPECDLAIIDGSPGIGCPVIASISGVDLVLIVAEPSYSGISDLKRLVKTIASFQTIVVICVNKYDTSILCTEEIEKYCKEQSLHFVGKIPYDKVAIQAVNSGNTIADSGSPASISVKEIYNNINTILNQ